MLNCSGQNGPGSVLRVQYLYYKRSERVPPRYEKVKLQETVISLGRAAVTGFPPKIKRDVFVFDHMSARVYVNGAGERGLRHLLDLSTHGHGEKGEEIADKDGPIYWHVKNLEHRAEESHKRRTRR